MESFMDSIVGLTRLRTITDSVDLKPRDPREVIPEIKIRFEAAGHSDRICLNEYLLAFPIADDDSFLGDLIQADTGDHGHIHVGYQALESSPHLGREAGGEDRSSGGYGHLLVLPAEYQSRLRTDHAAADDDH